MTNLHNFLPLMSFFSTVESSSYPSWHFYCVRHGKLLFLIVDQGTFLSLEHGKFSWDHENFALWTVENLLYGSWQISFFWPMANFFFTMANFIFEPWQNYTWIVAIFFWTVASLCFYHGKFYILTMAIIYLGHGKILFFGPWQTFYHGKLIFGPWKI